jgi:hypothetical protein
MLLLNADSLAFERESNNELRTGSGVGVTVEEGVVGGLDLVVVVVLVVEVVVEFGFAEELVESGVLVVVVAGVFLFTFLKNWIKDMVDSPNWL